MMKVLGKDDYMACVYGLYNYNVDIGNKNLDPILRIQIEEKLKYVCLMTIV